MKKINSFSVATQNAIQALLVIEALSKFSKHALQTRANWGVLEAQAGRLSQS